MKLFLKDSEREGNEGPSASKFESRDIPGPLRRWIGAKSGPVLCDFAREGKDLYTEYIQLESALSSARETHIRSELLLRKGKGAPDEEIVDKD